jgi:hypothetical protein
MCVHLGAAEESLPGFENVLLSLFVGAVTGLLAALPPALALREWIRGLHSIGHG